MTNSTVDIDEIRIALEIAGRIANKSLDLSDVSEEVNDHLHAEEIDGERFDVVRTLVRSFWLFARNVQIGSIDRRASDITK